MEQVIDIYKRTGDFMECVYQTGLPAFRIHIILAKSGLLKISDKIKYGSKAQILGGKAEEYFQKLIPEALDANRYIRKNNPGFDYVYKDMTIDVKWASVAKKRKGTGQKEKGHESWDIRASGGQDITVAFLERTAMAGVNKPYILVIPNGFIHVKGTMTITPKGEIFRGCIVTESELINVLNAYAEVFHKEKGSDV